MLISVVVPVFNGRDTISSCIDSIVLAAKEVELELIVIDGGSTDGTVELLRSIERIDILISEPDDGQYSAIHKGLNLAKGEVVTWLNADDVFLPYTLSVVQTIFQSDSDIAWLRGANMLVDNSLRPLNLSTSPHFIPGELIKRGLAISSAFGFIQQEGSFWTKSLYEKVGGLNLELDLAADYDLWRKFAREKNPVYYEYPLAAFRLTGENRSVVNHEKYLMECFSSINNKLIRILLRSNVLVILRLIPLGFFTVYSMSRRRLMKKYKRIGNSNSLALRMSKWI